MTRREREMRIEWCRDRLQTATATECKELTTELAHYARQDRRRAKRRNTK